MDILSPEERPVSVTGVLVFSSSGDAIDFARKYKSLKEDAGLKARFLESSMSSGEEALSIKIEIMDISTLIDCDTNAQRESLYELMSKPPPFKCLFIESSHSRLFKLLLWLAECHTPLNVKKKPN